MQNWKLLTRTQSFHSKWLSVVKDKVQLPNNLIIDDFYVIQLPDAAMIVALDAQNNILLKKEYRHSVQETLLELPAGAFESGETDALEVARRELLEEKGYSSEDWQFLGTAIDNPSKCSNHLHVFRNCS